MNYYNDNDERACFWLEALIEQGSLPKGRVDSRSIEEVDPDEVKRYTQAHFFAGIGGWSLALQLAGWSPDRPVWTASLPCQPFSVAGEQRGEGDERHLFPVFLGLVRECKPDTIFGEQVPNAVRLGWLDGVSDALAGEGYAVGATVLPACSVGAPHIRQRLWWVADSPSTGLQGRLSGGEDQGREALHGQSGSGSSVDWQQSIWLRCRDGKTRRIPAKAVPESRLQPMAHGLPQGMDGSGPKGDGEKEEEVAGWATPRGYPQEADPDLYPLAPSTKGRTGILKGAGNAIVPQVGAVFVRAFLEVKGEL